MRLLRRGFLPGSLGLILWAALVVPLPVVLRLPGEPASLGGAVTVDGGGRLNGDYLLTKVRMRRGTVAGLFEVMVVDGSDVRPEQQVIPPGTPDADYFARQRDVFALAAQVAAAVALREAGFDADPRVVVGSGARVVALVPGAPADGVLRPGDVVVAVDGQPVAGVDDLREGLAGAPDGPRSLRFRRDAEEHEAVLVPAPLGEGRRGIGVHVETHDPRVPLPAEVEIDGGDVGGPSAGLMIALTVYDLATPDVDLAAGRRVAGTGSLTPEGVIGAVGAVEQKAISAHRLGADVFVVPTAQAHRAAAAIPPGATMRVLAASTLTEALEVLGTAAAEARGT